MLRSNFFFIVFFIFCLFNSQSVHADDWEFAEYPFNFPRTIVDYSGTFEYVDTPIHSRPQALWTFDFGGSAIVKLDIKWEWDDEGWTTIHEGHITNEVHYSQGAWLADDTLSLEVRFWNEAAEKKGPYEHTVYTTPNANSSIQKGDALHEAHIIGWSGNSSFKDALPILIIEGFDPANNNYPAFYRNKGGAFIQELINAGHDVYILNFDDGGADMKDNAEVLSSAIEFLDNNVVNEDESLGVIGISMGGVIARYALKKNEEQNNPLNVSHLVTYDSPNEGATLDLNLLDFIKDEEPDHPSLSSTAAKQLVIDNPFDDTGSIHDDFYDDLMNLNGGKLPDDVRSIAVSLGGNKRKYPVEDKWLTIERPLPEIKDQ